MKVYLQEITDRETELSFTHKDDWVRTAAISIDEASSDEYSESQEVASHRPVSDKAVEVSIGLRRVDDVYIISGKIDTHIELVCSRCAKNFDLKCVPRFSALFCKDPVMAGVAHFHRQQLKKSDINFGRTSLDRQSTLSQEGSLLESKDLDITYLSEDYIDLADVLMEQLQLQVPFQPLCEETCKGICIQCGTDLNFERCSCKRKEARNPFSVLRDFKI